MKIFKLTQEEKKIIKSIQRGEWEPVKNLKELKDKFSKIAQENIDLKKKNKRINIRINEYDLELLKQKAITQGLPYQTFISSELHKIAYK